MQFDSNIDRYKININGGSFYCNLPQELINKLKSYSLLRRKSLLYKLFINNREKQLSCPMLKFPDRKNVVLWPSIKLPHRKYTVHIYFYAAALYFTSGICMREVALKVRQKFGLENFSHSTLSRLLKKLSLNVFELLSIINADSLYPDSGPPFIKRIHWNDDQTSRYTQILLVIYPVLSKDNEIVFASTMNYKYFNRFHKFLI